ncbi:MAG: hypothetical protein JRG76_03765 [Deltaproteobacteria bacterium]|nr:hypothetical protein [Deltaproteobacteria bacterium]MBW2413607.1 hypothetical protein [Deltaproteobacteria bacterium]
MRNRLGIVACLALLTACAVLMPESWQLRGWQRQASQLRGLSFDVGPPLKLRHVTADEVHAILTREMAASYPADYVAAYERAYKALGLLPRELDLVKTLLELQRDQIVGLYTPSDDVMYVRRDLPPGQDDIDTIVIHELVHALQARHFPQSMGILRGLRHNDDVAAGIAAATEGDASLTMLGVPDDDLPLHRDLRSARRVRRIMMVDLEHPTGGFARAPRLLQRSLIFPYAEGTVVAALYYQQGGNWGLDRMMTDPPLSSLHFFEPELGAGEGFPVEFVGLPLEPLAAAVPAGCAPGHHNVAGALGLRVLFEVHVEDATEEEITGVVSSWRGDRFLHVGCPDGDGFFWLTRWASARDAQRFAALYERAAPSIASNAELAAPPAVRVEGRQAVVFTSRLSEALPVVLHGTRVRAYHSFGAWLRDDCFPESPCPGPGWGAATGRGRARRSGPRPAAR